MLQENTVVQSNRTTGSLVHLIKPAVRQGVVSHTLCEAQHVWTAKHHKEVYRENMQFKGHDRPNDPYYDLVKYWLAVPVVGEGTVTDDDHLVTCLMCLSCRGAL
jgi:hypothetical protein